MSRLIVLSVFCLLALTSSLLAQEAVQDVMLEKGPFQPLTSENWDAAEVVGLINGRGISAQGWIDNSRIAALSDAGLWIYTLGSPDKTRLIPLSYDPETKITSISTTPNKRWLWFVRGDRFTGLFDLDNEHYVGKPEDMMLPAIQVWSGNILLLHPADNHNYIDGFSNRVQLWDMSGSTPILLANLLHPHTTNTPYIVSQAIVSADAKTLVTATRAVISQQRVVSLWDIATGIQRIIYEDPLLTDEYFPVIALQWDEDESSFAVMTPTEALRFAMPTGERLDSFTYPWCYDDGQKLQWIDYQRDELVCFSGLPDRRTLDIWRLSDNTIAWTSKEFIPDDNASWTLPDFIGKGSSTPSDWIILNATKVDGVQTLSLINYRTGEEKTTSTYIHGGLLSPDQTHVLLRKFFDWEKTGYSASIVDIEADTQTSILPTSRLWDLLFLPDGDLLTLGTNGITRYSFTAQTRTLLPTEAEGVMGMALHPDGRLYIGYKDGNISVYNLETETVETRIDNSRPVLDLTFTPDGTKMLVASESTIVLRDSDGGFLSQQPAVRFVTFNTFPLISADGQWASINHSLYRIEGTRLISVAPEDVGEDVPDFIRVLADYAIYDPYFGSDPSDLDAYRAALPVYLIAAERTYLAHIPSVFPRGEYRVYYPFQGPMSDTMIAVLDTDVIWLYAVPTAEEK